MTKLFSNETLDTFKAEAIDVGEHTLYFESGQNGDTVDRTFLLVHGAFATGEFMKVIATEIIQSVRNARVIILDLPWHGRSIASEKDLSQATIHTYAEVAHDFIQALKERGDIKGKLHWIGWSMGGSIGQLLALKNTGLDELTLLNSSPVWHSLQGVVNAVPAMLDNDAIKDVYRSILEGELNQNITEEDKETVMGHYNDLTAADRVMTQDLRAILPNNYDITDRIQDIKEKTLIFSGEKDSLAEGKYQELLNERIEQSKLVLTDDNHLQLVKVDIVKELVREINEYFVQ